MIINITKKDDKVGAFISQPKAYVKMSKSGKAISFLISENSDIIITKDGKSKTITGKAFIKTLTK